MDIRIKNLCFRYENASQDTIDDFNLELQKGDIVSIQGQSGSGKSTLLRILCGFEVPRCGSIEIGGRVVVSDGEFVLPENRGIGMVFQDYALFPHMTVSENIEFGISRMSKVIRQKRVQNMLSLVDLEGYEKRYPHELSGGQQQRVALARAIAPKPGLILLDEPFSNLDADLKAKIRNDLKKIIKETNITSIFVTHDREDSRVLADKTVILERGKLKNII